MRSFIIVAAEAKNGGQRVSRVVWSDGEDVGKESSEESCGRRW